VYNFFVDKSAMMLVEINKTLFHKNRQMSTRSPPGKLKTAYIRI